MLVGEEYRPPFYGHMFFLGLREHLISPFTTGYEGTGIESLYPSNSDMLRKARAQGAVTGYVHPWSYDTDPLDSRPGSRQGVSCRSGSRPGRRIRMVEPESRAIAHLASRLE